MKKLLLCILLTCAMLCVGSVGYAIYFDERLAKDLEERGMEEVFWSHLQYDGIPVDLSMPPPGYDPAKDPNLEYTLAKGYKSEWDSYFYTENPVLTWNGISFHISDRAPNYNMWWCEFDTFIAWEFYFTEMFYEGGPAYPMDEETFVQFWSGLRHEGKPVDPFTAPPNYDPEMDY